MNHHYIHYNCTCGFLYVILTHLKFIFGVVCNCNEVTQWDSHGEGNQQQSRLPGENRAVADEIDREDKPSKSVIRVPTDFRVQKVVLLRL